MYETAVAAIEAADLSAECYRAARRMLDIAAQQNGVLYLSREAACELCGVGHWGSVRRMLAQLTEAGIIQHHTNNRAYVLFPQWPAVNNPRTTGAPPRTPGAAEAAEPRTASAPTRTTGAADEQPRTTGAPARTTGAPARTTGAPLRDRDWDRDWDGGISLPTLPEGGAGETQPPPATDTERSVRLLTDPDVGLSQPLAASLARQYAWDEIRRQVFRWARDRSTGSVRSPGAILSRMKQGFPASVLPEDKQTALWQRHADPGEEAADRANRYQLN